MLHWVVKTLELKSYGTILVILETETSSLLREALTTKGKFVQNIQSKLAESEEISMNEKGITS